MEIIIGILHNVNKVNRLINITLIKGKSYIFRGILKRDSILNFKII